MTGIEVAGKVQELQLRHANQIRRIAAGARASEPSFSGSHRLSDYYQTRCVASTTGSIHLRAALPRYLRTGDGGLDTLDNELSRAASREMDWRERLLTHGELRLV